MTAPRRPAAAPAAPDPATPDAPAVDLHIVTTVRVPAAILDLIGRFAPAHVLHLEAHVAKLTADLTKLRKALDKMKAAKAKADADEAAEDEAAAKSTADFQAQIAALQEKLANVPPQPTAEEQAQAEKDQADLDALVAEFNEFAGPDEPAPEPTPAPTPTPEPTPAPDGGNELPVNEVDPNS